ncbi:hypothetical protein BASA81_010123 [Batrachochytrium salamandrivorans]|nr:hypothetical protein BASA81_010123 [Batrachochytrium salamandrivorans]
MNVLLLAPLAMFLVLKFLVNPFLRKRAWRVSVANDNNVQLHPGKHTVGWTLWGQSPGYDARGQYQVATHTHIYFFKSIYSSMLFLPMAVQWYMDAEPKRKIKDQSVFDFCTKTSMVILTKFESDERFVFEMDPKKMPSTFDELQGCDLNTMRIVFNVETECILEATSKNGPVLDSVTMGRNEILLMALRNLNAIWVHPTIHVGSEKNALEIQAKRVEELEPSCHFVSSLHEGLLHGPLGPLSQNGPFYGGSGSCAEVVANTYSHPFPPHVLDERKMRFPTYKFLIAGRKEVFSLVRKYQLKVDPEYLFLNLVMHEIDHEAVFEVLAATPLCSATGDGSLWSCWLNHSFVHIWLQHWDNPTSSDLVISNLDRPFYADLYARMSQVDQARADQMVVACCF